jgi:hypothetical protein
MGNYATTAELQEDAASWVWHQIDSGARAPIELGPTLNTPTWSEFDAITPDGSRVTVRVELKR